MNNGKICVSVCAETADELAQKLRAVEDVADIIELRFDCLGKGEIEAAQHITSAKPLIATFRSHEQGGNSDATRAGRLEFWTNVSDRFFAVDLEEDIFASVKTSAKRIISFHDHQAVPADLDERVAKMLAAQPDIVKVAVRADDAVDGIDVWKILDDGTSAVPVAMGEAGKWTRILGLAHGSYLTYASLDAGSETADGQLTAKDLIDVYRVKELTPDTKVFGVIGSPVSGSMSPYIHNPAFQAAGVDAVFMHLEVKDLDAFIRRMVRAETREVELNFGGFSVTMPHKQAIIKYLDEIDPVAEKVGAVNTVKIVDGRLIGYNTDAGGFIKPLKEKYGSIRDVHVVVAGAGGAARAVVYALAKEGALVTVLARDSDKAAQLARHFDVEYGQLTDTLPNNVDIVVNATPLGMRGENSDKKLFTADRLAGVKFVCDLVTSAQDTPLLNEAQIARVPAFGGIEMLLAQAEMQFEIWTGVRPEEGLMRRSLLARLQP